MEEDPPEGESGKAQDADDADQSKRRYRGHFKSVGGEYGFIECAETKRQFARDVHVKKVDVPLSAWKEYQVVTFCVEVVEQGGKRRPQAREVEVVEGEVADAGGDTPGTEVAPPGAAEALILAPRPVPRRLDEEPLQRTASSQSRDDSPLRRTSSLRSQPESPWADVVDDPEDGVEGGEGAPCKGRRRRKNKKGGSADGKELLQLPVPEEDEEADSRPLPLLGGRQLGQAASPGAAPHQERDGGGTPASTASRTPRRALDLTFVPRADVDHPDELPTGGGPSRRRDELRPLPEACVPLRTPSNSPSPLPGSRQLSHQTPPIGPTTPLGGLATGLSPPAMGPLPPPLGLSPAMAPRAAPAGMELEARAGGGGLDSLARQRMPSKMEVGALWSSIDLVRALCFRRTRRFILDIEGEMLRLLSAPPGAYMRIPGSLGGHYRSLLTVQCARFQMQETHMQFGDKLDICVCTTLCSRAPLPAAALVPGTWAGTDPQEWIHGEPIGKPLNPIDPLTLRIPSKMTFTPYTHTIVGMDEDGDAVARSAVQAAGPSSGPGGGIVISELPLPNGQWELVEPKPCSDGTDLGGFVLTFSVERAATQGVAVAICADYEAAQRPLSRLLSCSSPLLDERHEVKGERDFCIVELEPRPSAGRWSLRFGHVEQANAGQMQQCETSFSEHSQATETFWVATWTTADGGLRVEVGRERFPWCPLMRGTMRQQSCTYCQAALATLGSAAPGAGGNGHQSLRNVTMESSLCPDPATRDHIVRMVWPPNNQREPSERPTADGVVKMLDGGIAVCNSHLPARELAEDAAAQGWQVACLATAPLNNVGVDPTKGVDAGGVDEVLSQRQQAVVTLEPRMALDLGLTDWANAIAIGRGLSQVDGAALVPGMGINGWPHGNGMLVQVPHAMNGVPDRPSAGLEASGGFSPAAAPPTRGLSDGKLSAEAPVFVPGSPAQEHHTMGAPAASGCGNAGGYNAWCEDGQGMKGQGAWQGGCGQPGMSHDASVFMPMGQQGQSEDWGYEWNPEWGDPGAYAAWGPGTEDGDWQHEYWDDTGAEGGTTRPSRASRKERDRRMDRADAKGAKGGKGTKGEYKGGPKGDKGKGGFKERYEAEGSAKDGWKGHGADWEELEERRWAADRLHWGGEDARGKGKAAGQDGRGSEPRGRWRDNGRRGVDLAGKKWQDDEWANDGEWGREWEWNEEDWDWRGSRRDRWRNAAAAGGGPEQEARQQRPPDGPPKRQGRYGVRIPAPEDEPASGAHRPPMRRRRLVASPSNSESSSGSEDPRGGGKGSSQKASAASGLVRSHLLKGKAGRGKGSRRARSSSAGSRGR